VSIRNTIRDFLVFLASFVPQITRMGTDSVFHDPRLSAKSAVYIHLRFCRARLISGSISWLRLCRAKSLAVLLLQFLGLWHQIPQTGNEKLLGFKCGGKRGGAFEI
jgi:hypothetical protein